MRIERTGFNRIGTDNGRSPFIERTGYHSGPDSVSLPKGVTSREITDVLTACNEKLSGVKAPEDESNTNEEEL